ncbi:DUF3568 family protein [Francisella noatunensis]|uniref:DUF3568 family protein n=1 Tax=Francisella noatunensis TaxID=657445 RepID=UPI001F421F05|nr:DUF3568 family protein [Francisella noatunensis]
MLSQKLLNALNDQFNYELESANLYLAMAGYTSDLGLGGFTNWFMAQYENGYYIAELNYSFDKVYQVTINSIKAGITYDGNGHAYDLVENSQTNDKATITAINNKNHSDQLEIIIHIISKNITKIMIKYDSNGDSIRSSALLNTLKEGLAI